LLSSIAVPLTNGFVGEFLILLGVFKVQKVIAALAVLGVVFGATYMLWMFKRVFFGKRGELVNDVQHPLQDLNLREIGILTPFIILIFWMGVFPMDFLKWSDSSIKHFVENKRNYYLTVSESPSTKKVARLGVPNVRN
jgi:NADH-quinone oxidoreductase subunit M